MKINSQKIKEMTCTETQAQAAARVGISTQAFNALLMRGTCSPPTLAKLAAALDVEPQELLRKE